MSSSALTSFAVLPASLVDGARTSLLELRLSTLVPSSPASSTMARSQCTQDMARPHQTCPCSRNGVTSRKSFGEPQSPSGATRTRATQRTTVKPMVSHTWPTLNVVQEEFQLSTTSATITLQVSLPNALMHESFEEVILTDYIQATTLTSTPKLALLRASRESW